MSTATASRLVRPWRRPLVGPTFFFPAAGGFSGRRSFRGDDGAWLTDRADTPAEQVYPRLGFVEYGRLPRGIKESWGDQRVFDMVYLYQPLGPTEGQ